MTYTVYKVKEGGHFGWPFPFNRIGTNPYGMRVFGRWVIFDDTAEYDLGDEDQKDWNKLLGMRFHLCDNHKNSIMCGWRWNKNLRVIELNLYYHMNGKRYMTDTLATVKPGETIAVFFTQDEVHANTRLHIQFENGEVIRSPEIEYDRYERSAWEIRHYFGGNEAAPHDVTILMDSIKGYKDADSHYRIVADRPY